MVALLMCSTRPDEEFDLAACQLIHDADTKWGEGHGDAAGVREADANVCTFLAAT